MPTLLEIQIRKAEKAKRSIQKAKDDADKARADQLAAKRAAIKSRLAVRNMLGDTILLAFESGEITPQEHALVSGLWMRRKDKPANKDLMAKDWEVPTDATAHPANDPKPAKREPEFARTGK